MDDVVFLCVFLKCTSGETHGHKGEADKPCRMALVLRAQLPRPQLAGFPRGPQSGGPFSFPKMTEEDCVEPSECMKPSPKIKLTEKTKVALLWKSVFLGLT